MKKSAHWSGRDPWFARGATALGAALIAAAAIVLFAASPARAQDDSNPDDPAQTIHISHAIAMNDEPKYGEGFTHFDYVNPDAPVGGVFRDHEVGSFDSFNPFIARGLAATGIGLVFDTLTVQSYDEPFTEYGLIAEKIEWPEDRSWVIFHIDPRARFHDGEPVTASDVAFSFNLLVEQGSPVYRQYYGGVDTVEVLDDTRVKFSFLPGDNRELPLILGQLPVLPEHWWQDRDFESPGLEPPLGSGPYMVEDFRPGHSVTFRRVDDYWAWDHPAVRGHYNFERIRYDYYRDSTVALEAFKAGEYDYRQENTAKLWATSYGGRALDRGLIRMETIQHQNTQGMQGFFYNTRRGIFADPLVREALAYAFDFEWTNRNFFFSSYTRCDSYWSNSELGSSGLPSPGELEILEPLRDLLPPRVFTEEYQPPVTDGSGYMRPNLLRALELLSQAGWELHDRRLVNARGEQFAFEILLYSPALERVALPFAHNLERMGIDVELRMVDTTQYVNRLRSFDFDMTTYVFGQSMSPGNEQYYFWHSSSRDMPGSRNFAGIADPAVDQLVEMVVAAPDREQLVLRTRSLDRALLWGFYCIPHWYFGAYRVAYWDKFSRPAIDPPYGLDLYTWWVDPEKEAALERALEDF